MAASRAEKSVNFTGHNEKGRAVGPAFAFAKQRRQLVALFRTVTARRFWDQQLLSLQTATGRSLP